MNSLWTHRWISLSLILFAGTTNTEQICSQSSSNSQPHQIVSHTLRSSFVSHYLSLILPDKQFRPYTNTIVHHYKTLIVTLSVLGAWASILVCRPNNTSIYAYYGDKSSGALLLPGLTSVSLALRFIVMLGYEYSSKDR